VKLIIDDHYDAEEEPGSQSDFTEIVDSELPPPKKKKKKT
jgi:hypothetical protein